MPDDLQLSRTLSYILRHRPDTFGLTLDQAGWLAVEELLAALRRHGRHVSREDLARVVRESDKQRFALSEDGSRIRANQGHSTGVDLGYAPREPPVLLFHGTVDRFIPSIRARGLEKRARHHVHLSATREPAELVGGRRGQPVVLEIDASAMHIAGYAFFCSANGVWLTEHVPPEFIRFPGA